MIRCKDCAQPPELGRGRCAECAANHRQREAARRERLAQARRCTCGERAPEKGRAYCQPCLDYYAERYHRLYRERRLHPFEPGALVIFEDGGRVVAGRVVRTTSQRTLVRRKGVERWLPTSRVELRT